METTAHTKRRRLSNELLPQSYNLVLVPDTADHPSTSTSSATTSRISPSTSTTNQLEINQTDSAMAIWQQNQMLKCVEDNSINRVLESYLHYFGENTNIGNIPVRNFSLSTGLAEESAILMAISEHGLQNPEVVVERVLVPNLNQSVENEVCNFTYVEHESSVSSSSSSSVVEQEPHRRNSDENEPLINEEMFNEHFDFMEQAIQSAIQKKGLTPLVTSQMSPTR